ncbi:hypothetical protein [Methanocella sp. MCL-LM]|uniref:hypothetical protein n=1 Tax=Methanocella sp. MCL-LM TaxID=3412035 RepID=UPI003C78348E
MIKVRIAYVLVAAGLLFVLASLAANAAFGFSFPMGTIVAGPGLAAAGPTTFNTYSHDATMANSQAAADAAVNGFSPLPGVLPGMPFGCGYGLGPFGVANVANSMVGANAAEDHTFATSFSTAGGIAGVPALGGVHFAGAYPEFALNLF